jgi:hypothetical protein
MKCFGKIQIEFMNNFFVLYIYKCQTDPHQHTAQVEEVVVDQDPQPHLVPEPRLAVAPEPHPVVVPDPHPVVAHVPHPAADLPLPLK